MQLSPQTIRYLSERKNLITPFQEHYNHEPTGLSGGLSCAGYDVHLAEITLAIDKKRNFLFDEIVTFEYPLGSWVIPPRTSVLGSTIERFDIPNDICMHYYNKSTLARRFLDASATLAEPGWKGHLTLELSNRTDKYISVMRGQPIGQVIFMQLDAITESPYQGKYQNQGNIPVPGI